jgi:hypothetical protein
MTGVCIEGGWGVGRALRKPHGLRVGGVCFVTCEVCGTTT